MFDNAPKLKKERKPKAEKKKVKDVNIPGMQELSAIDAVIKILTAMRNVVDIDVKTKIGNYFIEQGIQDGALPDNFMAVEGAARGSAELRRRGPNSALTEDQVTVLDNYKIAHQTVELVADTFVINPKYKDDRIMLKKVERKLRSVVPGIPVDFILHQEGESKEVVGDNALEQIFEISDKNVVRKLMNIVALLIIRPGFSDDIDVMNLAKKFFNKEPEEGDKTTIME